VNWSVYVMSNGDGHLKIGISQNLALRAKELKVPVVYTRLIGSQAEATAVERGAHKLLWKAGRHVNNGGEWFVASFEEAVDAIERSEEGHTIALPGGYRIGQLKGRHPYTGCLSIQADEEFFEMLDEVRIARRPIPSRTDMVRSLVREEHDRVKKRERSR